MKANEAPEKIYLHIRPNKEIGCTWHGNKIGDTDIEYIRTDAFIEKVYDWLMENVEKHISADGEYTVYYKEMFEDFRKYIED